MLLKEQAHSIAHYAAHNKTNWSNFIYLSEVTGVEFIHQNSVVMLTTGISSSTGSTSVLADTTVTSRNVTPFLSVLVQSGRLKTMQFKKLIHEELKSIIMA